MTISEYLKSQGIYQLDEGHCQEVTDMVDDIANIVKNNKNIDVMEIGFNAGHSAEIFLSNNNNLRLTSFDLGRWNYVNISKKYIDNVYPERHNLILGDSAITVPKFVEENPNTKFDIIYVDGSHDEPMPLTDLLNCKKLAHSNTIVIMDDITHTYGWSAPCTLVPTKAWDYCLENNIIFETKRIEYCKGRGMCVGTYNLTA